MKRTGRGGRSLGRMNEATTLPAPTPPRTRWQYHIIGGHWGGEFLAELNAAGADGWQAIGITQGDYGPKVLVSRPY